MEEVGATGFVDGRSDCVQVEEGQGIGVGLSGKEVAFGVLGEVSDDRLVGGLEDDVLVPEGYGSDVVLGDDHLLVLGALDGQTVQFPV